MDIAYTVHRSRKDHHCWHYWQTRCAGTGKIAKGQLYFCPVDDCEDPFHPYRTCESCRYQASVAKNLEELNTHS